MFRKILLIFLFCGLTVLSVVLEYRATAGTSICPSPRGPCVPVEPPACETSNCEKVVGYQLRGVETFHKTLSYRL